MHAPIALFTYNRPAHTERLFESLARWDGLADSPLHVYCDGPKHAAHAESVARQVKALYSGTEKQEFRA